MPKLSVVLSMHNRENLLPRTLSSLKNQDYKDFEVIMVDDASEDNTASVAESMTAGDPRFKLIKLSENSGVSAVRNMGLDMAQGEYIRFLDDDDVFPKNSLKKMVDRAEETGGDLIIGAMYFETPFGLGPVSQAVKLSKKDVIAKDDSDIIHTFSVGNKLFRRSVIEENHIRFENIKLAEDALFLLDYIRCCNGIYGHKANVYNYYKAMAIEERSITQQRNTESLENLILNMEKVYSRLPFPTDDVISEYTYRFFSTSLIQSYYQNIWILDSRGEEILLNKMKELWADLPDNQKERVYKKYPGMLFQEGFFTKEEMLGKTRAVIAISPDMSEEEKRKVIDSAYRQKMPFFKIVLSEKDIPLLPETVQAFGNFLAVSAEEKNDVFNKGIELAGETGSFISFANEPILYSGKTLEEAERRLEGRDKDLVIGDVYSIENNTIYTTEKSPLSSMFFSGLKLRQKGASFDDDGLKGRYSVYYYPGIRLFTESTEGLEEAEDAYLQLVGNNGEPGRSKSLVTKTATLHVIDLMLQKNKPLKKNSVLFVSATGERPSAEMRKIYLTMPRGKRTTFYLQSPNSIENKKEIKTLLYNLATNEFVIIDGESELTRLHKAREGQKICRLDKGENPFEVFGWKEKKINVAF